jgi:hypothetical protein
LFDTVWSKWRLFRIVLMTFRGCESHGFPGKIKWWTLAG